MKGGQGNQAKEELRYIIYRVQFPMMNVIITDIQIISIKLIFKKEKQKQHWTWVEEP